MMPPTQLPDPPEFGKPGSLQISPGAEKAIFAAVFALSAFLCLWNLGSPRLWQDEAETALIGRNVHEVRSDTRLGR